MKMPFLLIAASVLLAACSADDNTAAPAQGAGKQLETVTVEMAAIEREIRFDGVIEAVNQATVAAQTSGRVTELPFEVGDYVKQGDVIVRLTATEQKAQERSARANLAAAEARLAEARQQFDRVRDLVERKLVAKADYDRVKANFDSASAQAAAAREALTQAQAQAGYTEITAPYSGLVVKRLVEPGETVSVGTPLMSGLSLEHLRVVVQIPQQHIGPLRTHQRARVILPDGHSLAASSLRIPPGADASTHTFRVLVNLPEGDIGVFPGTLVKVAFVAGTEERLLLPPQVIVQRAEITAVYVIDTNHNISLRYIRTGTPAVDGRVPVLAGLTAGEQVATDPLAAGVAYRKVASEAGND